MGLAQHHDAVSGTEKQHVANDYAQRLSDGIDQALQVINTAYAKLLPKTPTASISPQYLCPFSNISACLPIEGQERVGFKSHSNLNQLSFLVRPHSLESDDSSSDHSFSSACYSTILNS